MKTPEKQKEYTNRYLRKYPDRQLFKTARNRAIRRGIPFDIEISDIVIPVTCPILDIPLLLNLETGAGGKDNSFSLDRIDPAKGYVKGNVQVISHKANSMKFTATKEELLKFANWIYKEYKND